MQHLFNIMADIDIEGELTVFLCSALAFLMLVHFKHQTQKEGAKGAKVIDEATAAAQSVNDSVEQESSYDVKMDKALRTAFENEDYWQVVKCWNELKYFSQSSIHLAMVIRSLRFCNKGAYLIVGELKAFFKAHPQTCDVGVINDLLEPLSRRPEDAQLVDLFARLLPTLKIEKDSRTYELILTMHSASKNCAKAKETEAEMKNKGVVFTPRAHVALMTLWLQSGDIEAVLEVFTELKAVWEQRETWAVSMFALKGHKANLVSQMIALACQKQQVCELSTAFEGFNVPEDVIEASKPHFSHMSDVDLATTMSVLAKSGVNSKEDKLYRALLADSESRVATRSKWRAIRMQKCDMDASTSEGSRSDSEEESYLATTAKTCWKHGSNTSTSEGSRSDSEEECHHVPNIPAPPGLAAEQCC